MKKSLFLLGVLLASVGLAQAEGINQYDNVRIKEQGTITRQTTVQTDNMPAQVTIDGQPAYEIKEEVTTSPVEVSTEIIAE